MVTSRNALRGFLENQQEEKKIMKYFVNIYEIYRNFGGPEEGGWYYDSGEFVEIARIFTTQNKAQAWLAENSHEFSLTNLRAIIETHSGKDWSECSYYC